MSGGRNNGDMNGRRGSGWRSGRRSGGQRGGAKGTVIRGCGPWQGVGGCIFSAPIINKALKKRALDGTLYFVGAFNWQSI